MIDETRLREIEQRTSAATAGPWKEGRHDMVSYELDGREPFKNVYTDAPGLVHEVHKPTGKPLPITVARGEGGECLENAIFIAHARTDIPDLITALREERAENVRLREALRDLVMHATRMLCDYCDLHDDDTKHELFVQPTDKALDAARTALSRDAGREG